MDTPLSPETVPVGIIARITGEGDTLEVDWSDKSHHGKWPAALLAEALGAVVNRVVEPELWSLPPTHVGPSIEI